MGHITSKNYYDLQKRLNDSTQGAPASETLFKILKLIFNEKEAELVSLLPMNFFTLENAARLWNKDLVETKKILNELADKGILFDFKIKRIQAYFLAPTMAGFFEFTLMRTDGKFDNKVLSELFYQYINVEDEFLKEVLAISPHIGRVLIQEESVPLKIEKQILDYERASKIIKTASCITAGTCYCRHKMKHLGKACNNPQEVCLSFNKAAESLSNHKIARKINKKEALEILDRCIKLGLAQIGDNVQDEVNWICNCCSCCCEGIQAYKRLGYKIDLTSSFTSKYNPEKCTKCGICVKKCPVNAIEIKNGNVVIDNDKCFGCGVCVRFCNTKSLSMERRKKQLQVPKNSFERIILEAINQNKLQNYLFDNYTLFTHQILRKFLKTIISFTPTKQILANKQLQSRFIKAVLNMKKYKIAKGLSTK